MKKKLRNCSLIRKTHQTFHSQSQNDICFSRSVRNLGANFDDKLSMKQQVSKICQSAYLELRRISSIRHVLTVDAAKTLVTSLVLSRLDYCNSLLSGILNSWLTNFKRFKIVLLHSFSKLPNAYISPLLAKLHWLPIAHDMTLSKILLRCTCLISFAFTSLPVHCVPLLTPASFGFQHERKSSKGSVLSPISALSLGTNFPTLYAMLKHNSSSELN